MNHYRVITVLSATMLLLGGCGGGGGSNGTAVVQPAGALSQVASQAPDADPDPLSDIQGLIDDITALFGDAGATPVDVLDGDSVGDVITRAGG